MSSVVMNINQGTLASLLATFTTPTGKPADPTDVYAKFHTPPGPALTVWQYGGAGSISRVGVGQYLIEIDTTPAAGLWRGGVIGTGVVQATTSFLFNVIDIGVPLS